MAISAPSESCRCHGPGGSAREHACRDTCGLGGMLLRVATTSDSRPASWGRDTPDHAICVPTLYGGVEGPEPRRRRTATISSSIRPASSPADR